MIRTFKFLNSKHYALFCALIAMLFGATAVKAETSTNTVSGVEDADSGAGIRKRNPFWPVGYQPETSGSAETNKQADETTDPEDDLLNKAGANWEMAMKQVEIKGVSKAGNEFYAVINGEVKAVGDTVTVKLGALVYSWKVDSITPSGSVKLHRLTVQ